MQGVSASKKLVSRKKCSGPEKQGVRSGLVSGAGFGFSFVALYCMTSFCFYIGAVLVQHDKATFQEVFKVQHQSINQLNIRNIFTQCYLLDASFDILMRDFMQVFFSLTITAVGISQSSTLAPDTNKAKDSAASIFKILDSKPTIDSSSNAGETSETVTGDMELQHVCDLQLQIVKIPLCNSAIALL